MKNLLFILFLIPLITFSQEEIEEVVVVKTDTQIEEFTNSLGNSEIRVDFLDFLIFPALTIAYEKTNNSYSGFGSTLFLNLGGGEDSVGSNYSDKFILTPYYRFYFLESEDFGGYGIFAEVFTKFVFGKYDSENRLGSNNDLTGNYFDIAPGLAVGRKWINRKGFTLELLFGVGRNLLLDSDNENYYNNRTSGTVRAGVSVGKRF
jgi:hypothetical protein|tara:strand:+ start:288 stop:902 length:615 start_codon:yes stop_codon:yes gene_type:complete